MQTIPLPQLHRQPDTATPVTDTLMTVGWLVSSLVLLDIMASAISGVPTGVLLVAWLCLVTSPLVLVVSRHRRAGPTG